ncbi:MAG: nuclear transport factor 2 family protein [Acidimicrobiia bacterium]
MPDDRQSARTLVSDLVAAYNAKDLDGLAALYIDDARYWSALSDWTEGIDEIRSHIQELFELLPDEEMAIKSLVTDGQVAVVEFESTGTNPGGKLYEIEFTEVIELRGNRIESVRVYLDPEEVQRVMA